MKLALFDLDNTLIMGDSDHLWIDYLAEQGILDGGLYRPENERYLRAYEDGSLDIHAFLRFSLSVLAGHEPADLERLRATFVEEWIAPIIAPAAGDLLEKHRAEGDRLLIITATNRFITEPIARHLGVNELIATEPAMRAGRYTGEVAGTPCFREGKVERLEHWLAGDTAAIDSGSFYSDSHNDLPLLERVSRPVAVDPDPILADAAQKRHWDIISLRR